MRIERSRKLIRLPDNEAGQRSVPAARRAEPWCALRPRLRAMDCLSPGDFRPAETHRDPSGDKLPHEFAGMTSIIRHVISKLDAASPLCCHDPHFKRRGACRKTVPVQCQPVPLGEVEEHCRIATCGNDSSGSGLRLEPMLFKRLLPHDTLHSILSIEDEVCSTAGIEHGRRGSQMLEPASGFLATRAIAGAGQNRLADGFQSHLAASAHRGEVVVLFPVHCDRPFLRSDLQSYLGVSQK
jgi:hypothetical protein